MIDDIKKRALHRTRILEGQLRGLEKMIENEDYCVDILTLSLSIQKSLGSLNKLIVENHLRTHVTDMFDAGGDQREAAVGELLSIFELQARSATTESPADAAAAAVEASSAP
ncbi:MULTISPECIES: metal-sensitive transcriptional regulator [unclassified Leifsonia]|uniref:metal-sensitive transcriptional regulator n=1 Tax=unclassified Leifsonia TaxID=2663824 RepID=UPI0009E8A2DE|nr:MULTISPECIES: metal-sensitive transcriptional regulator [unclassified Leifsonia]